MPYRAAAVSAEWVKSGEELADAVDAWGNLIGLDTEFQRTNTFYPLPGLYQVVSDGKVYLLDPLTIEDWQPLVACFEDPDVVVIMHACGEDLELISHHLDAEPESVFDTQLAHAFVSQDFSTGYTNLVNKILAEELGKAQTRSNWLRRPLSGEQVRYACEDVVHLPELYEQLGERLADLDRLSWFEETMLDHGRYSPNPPDEYYRGVKKAWRLSGQELARLKLLAAWRERAAMAENVPRNRVVWDEHLLNFAQRSELSAEFIRETLPGPVARKYDEELVACHEEGLQAEPLPRLERPLNQVEGEVVKQLREVARTRAEEHQFAQELIARRRDLEGCVRHFVSTGELSPVYAGWRRGLVGAQFADLLETLR